MLRAWENRPDTIVCDEPLYAHYLLHAGFDHPGRDEIIARHETDWRRVADWLTGPLPSGKRVFYQKHMAHHLLPHVERDWLDSLTHALLIRDPDEMIVSLAKVIPEPTLADTGLPQQRELLRRLCDARGAAPPILDARDVLQRPREMLEALCAALGVPFDERMLRWPAGRRDTDGAWAPYWYANVERSTGFEPWRPRTERPPERLHSLAAACREIYEELHALRLTPSRL